ncbi:MAG: T9SS type A sorting domain-containing protein [Crocinitomicaceae bacterium]
MRKLLLTFSLLFGVVGMSKADICQTPTSTASGTDNSNVTATVTDFTCVGANPIVAATLDASIGTQCTVWYWYDILVDGVTVATQQCNQTGFDLTAYLPFTSVSIVSFDNPADGIGDNVTMVATVNLTYFPPCSNPPNFISSNVLTTTADLSWDPIGNAQTYTVEWGTPGFTPGTGAELGSNAGVAGTTSQATGLTAGNTYEAYVQTDCGSDGISTWAGPITFTTPFQPPLGVTCSTGFATYIFSNDMETNSGWTGDIGTGNAQWDFPVGTPGGNSTGTGPSAAASGTYYAEFEASGIVATTASMVTPMIDLSNANSQAELSFYMHAFGSDIGTLNVGVGTSPTGPFTTVFSWTGQYQTAATDPWEQIGVDISAYLGQQIYVEFNYGALTSGFEGDMSIDLVQVETCVTCPGPTNLSGTFTAPDMIFVDWTPGGTETAWNIEYGPSGFTPGTGTVENVTSAPHTLMGVTQNTLIDIYIQADCGGGDESALVGPITVSTLANDEACNAQWVTVDSTTVNYSNIGATTQVGEPGSTPNNTVWFKAIVPASGHMAIATCGTDFDSELEVFDASDCADFGTFTSLGYADFNPWSCAGSHPAGIELCGLTPGDTVLFWVGSWSATNTGTFPLTTWEITSDAGTGSLAEMCVADTVDLWQYLTGNGDMSGVWNYPSNPSAVIGSQFVAGNSTFAGDTVYYIVNNACDADTAAVAIDVYGLSQAGGDGSFTVCLNQPYDLYSGLTGTVDIGGTWYDPANNPTNSQQNAPNLPGQFNYDYIVSNGFCPADTSNIVVTVTSGCDWLNVEELYFEGVEVYPNPATENIFISNTGSDEVFSYEMTDAQGKLIATKENAINGSKTTEINIEQLETGLYLIKVYNENAARTFRVVKQ